MNEDRVIEKVVDGTHPWRSRIRMLDETGGETCCEDYRPQTAEPGPYPASQYMKYTGQSIDTMMDQMKPSRLIRQELK